MATLQMESTVQTTMKETPSQRNNRNEINSNLGKTFIAVSPDYQRVLQTSFHIETRRVVLAGESGGIT